MSSQRLTTENSVQPSNCRDVSECPSRAAHAPRSIGASGSVASTTSVSPGPSSAMRRFAIVRGRGQSSPRASTVVTIGSVTPAPALAAILATGEAERLYSGLSVLVSKAVDGERCMALATFRALEPLLAAPLGRAQRLDPP